MRTLLLVLVACVLATLALPEAEPGENSKVTICHVPPGNPDNVQIITVGERAVPAHLAHGDTVGDCPSVVIGCIPGEPILGPSGTIACSGAGLGECIATGILICANDGQSAECNDRGPLPPGFETCNGLDDDCNGLVDDQQAAACPVGPLNEPGVCLGEFGCSSHTPCNTNAACSQIIDGAMCDLGTGLCQFPL